MAGFTAKGFRLENGWLIGKEFGHFKHAIETSPGSQSLTVSLTIVNQSSQSRGAGNREQAYVSASRSANRVSWYTDDKAELRKAIQRSSLKLVASDIVKPPVPQAQPLRSRWRQRLAGWHRKALLARTRMPWHGQTPKHVQTQIQERQLGYGR